jgi:hypothetical protein
MKKGDEADGADGEPPVSPKRRTLTLTNQAPVRIAFAYTPPRAYLMKADIANHNLHAHAMSYSEQ